MSQERVREVLGQPLRVIHGANDFGPYTEFRYPHLVRVTFQGNASVTAVSTTGRFERTSAGVGVGSAESDVEAGVPGVRCEAAGNLRECHVGSFTPGKRVTSFLLRKGVVARVTVGFVID